MLSWKEYTKAIDVWSIGCIFAELLGRKPLFPGKDYIHQLNLITDVIGTPGAAARVQSAASSSTAPCAPARRLPGARVAPCDPERAASAAARLGPPCRARLCPPKVERRRRSPPPPGEADIQYIQSEKARRYIRSMPYKPPIPPEKIYPNANPLAIEMLQRLLVFNPSKRITVDEAPARVSPRVGPEARAQGRRAVCNACSACAHFCTPRARARRPYDTRSPPHRSLGA